MATPADVALQRKLQAPEPEAGAASKVVTALWVLGLFTASVAIILVVREPLPPVPGLHKNAYLLAVSVAFLAGVAGVMAAVSYIGSPTTPTAARCATGRKKLLYSAAAAVVIGGFMVVVSLLYGKFVCSISSIAPAAFL